MRNCLLFLAQGLAVLLVALGIGVGREASAEVIASDPFDYRTGDLDRAAGGMGWAADAGWKTPKGHTQYLCDELLSYDAGDGRPIGGPRSVAIHGTGQRNNPLRRQLAAPFTGDELFVRFLLRYDAASIDDAGLHGDGEFFVLWLDDLDGGDGAGHNLDIPNIGLSVFTERGRPAGDKKNYFMVRIGADQVAFSKVELKGNQTYLLVARLSKTQPGPLGSFDQLELWVNPEPSDNTRPAVAVARGRGSNTVSWVGFSTGKRTEPDDLIFIDELALGERWCDVVPGCEQEVAANGDRQPDSIARAAAAMGEVDFGRDVYPILRDRCFACHQGAEAESGHRLDRRDEIVGLNQGKALAIPEDSKNSPLYQLLITSDEAARMPQGEDPLSAEEIAIVRAWIDQGLVWDESLLPTTPARSDHPMFQPVVRPEVPSTKWLKPRGDVRHVEAAASAATHSKSDAVEPVDADNPIDSFIAAKHRELNLAPAPPADRRTLLRRVTLDLTGLPPTPEELADFLDDDSPDAYRKAIDRLLSSTAYGERWGRHWLDIARWAESDGFQQNFRRPDAWRYRDYVVQSFANNKPYDEFLRQQIAGDELEPYSDENLIATGFLAAARYSGNELDKTIQRHDILIDVTNATSSALLGLTMQCAQCHNHKFDPITARDYYQYLGFFIKGQPVDVLLKESQSAPISTEQSKELAAMLDEQYELLTASRARLEANQRRQGLSIAVTQSAAIGSLPAEQKKRFQEIKARVDKYERTWAYYSPATGRSHALVPFVNKTLPLPYAPHLLQRLKPVLLYRGDLDSPGPEVEVSWPAVFGPAPEEKSVSERPRMALADWLTNRQNPLTARVWVNRIWQYHFGQGLVATPDDFGTQGAEPTHPELLDWLAAELMENGWDNRHLHRLILQSKTYRQAATYCETCAATDPENRYLWRWLPRRLEAESIRDSMLQASGLLDSTIGGPSVPLKERDASTRRTIYLEQKRGDLPYIQQLFDAPSTLTCCGRRRSSTVPLQPLFLLNNPETLRYATALAKRVVDDVGEDRGKQLDRAFELTLGRAPTNSERGAVDKFFAELEATSTNNHNQFAPDHPLVQLCQGLMNLNEFLYLP